MDRSKFERIVVNKARIGIPFTLEDVLETGKCGHMMMPKCDCEAPRPNGQYSAWMTALIKGQHVMKIGEKASTNPAARGRKVAVYGGSHFTYEEDEEPEVGAA